jgi:hypothetical protein
MGFVMPASPENGRMSQAPSLIPSTANSQQVNASCEEHLPAACLIPGYWDTVSSNTDDWAPTITVSALWRAANAELSGWKKEYQRELGGILLKGSTLGAFIGKGSNRIKEKTLEKITRSSDRSAMVRKIFDQTTPVPNIEDLVRARIETQFLDGVPFLARKLHDLAKKYDDSAILEPKGNLSGYFAQHLRFRLPVHFAFAGAASSCLVTCEVQVATVLATLVWETSHGLYEGSRVSQERSEDWQWSPNDPRFLSRQLGHMIHLADGLFCSLRDKSGTVI